MNPKADPVSLNQPKEPFSWAKFLSGFTTGLGWVKALSLLIKIVIVLVIVGVPVVCYNNGHKTGKLEGFAQGYSQAIKDNPPQVYNGSATVNNNPIAKPVSKFGISGFGWTLGACHI